MRDCRRNMKQKRRKNCGTYAGLKLDYAPKGVARYSRKKVWTLLSFFTPAPNSISAGGGGNPWDFRRDTIPIQKEIQNSSCHIAASAGSDEKTSQNLADFAKELRRSKLLGRDRGRRVLSRGSSRKGRGEVAGRQLRSGGWGGWGGGPTRRGGGAQGGGGGGVEEGGGGWGGGGVLVS